MRPGGCAGSERYIRPECLSQGMTLMRTRIVVVPTIRSAAGDRDGLAVFQRMLTDGSSAADPESSMVIDFAGAAEGQIMVSARAKKKVHRRSATLMACSACRARC